MNNKKLAAILGCCAVFVAVVVAIASLSPRAVADYSTLLGYLRSSGVVVEEKGEASWSFFYDVKGRRVTVDEISIVVYEYDSAGAMEADARCVSPDGFGIKKDWANGTGSAQQVGWIAPPHFHKAGRIIVFYCGDDASMINLLQDALGKQFAGM